MTLPNSIQKDRGEPSKVRIGTVSGGQILLQETVLTDVGVLGSYVPQDGDTVALLGQSSVGTSGTSWLALGRAETVDGMLGRSLVADEYEVASGNFFFQAVTAVIPGLTTTIDLPAGIYKVIVHGMLDIVSNVVGPVAVGECRINGVVQASQIVFLPLVAGSRGMNGQNWHTILTLAEETSVVIDMTARRAGGADNQITGNAQHSTMLVQIFR